MKQSILNAIKQVELQLFGQVQEAHEKVRRFWTLDEHTSQMRDGVFSTVVTELTKSMFGALESVTPVEGPRAEFYLERGKKKFKFRFHRARLLRKSDWGGYSAEDLESPRLNGISKGSAPDFVILWVSEGNRLMDLWACIPNRDLKTERGTQFACYRKVNGKRWAASYRLAKPELVLEGVGPRGRKTA